jgi:beta-lactamase regulating signal transducer with metallopeptidase domain
MTAFLADAFVKATLVLLIALGTAVLLRRSAAALRHLVWALACAGVLALPVASVALPDLQIAAWPRLDVPVQFDARQIEPTTVPPRLQSQPTRAATAQRPEPATSAPTSDVAPIRWRLHPDWRSLVLPVWLTGVALVLIALTIGLVRIAWLGRTASPVQDERWLTLVEELARSIGLRKHVRLLQSSGPAMPMTWGIRRPVILLPSDVDEWPAERRRDVLLHELAHVKRHDFLTQLIARVACAVYWFHPLVWLAATRLREERERACDDHVLRAGTKPSAYATNLLEIARVLRASPTTSLASVAMARPAQLATRLLDVLDARRCRDTLSPRAAAPAWILAALVVVPLAAVAPRVAQPTPRASPLFATAPIVTPSVRPVVRRAERDTLRGCSGQTTHSHSSTQVENDDVTISTNVGGCTIHLASVGKFAFNEDLTDIASVAAGGQVVVEVDYGAHDRRLTIRRGNDGTLERIYKVDGDVRPFDAEAKTWFTETITYLFRRTGYMAEERARWILDRRSIQGLIDEFGELQGDYTRRIYYQAAVESGKLDVAGYERLVGLAAQTIDSDYELAELLIAVSKAQPLTERMQVGFVSAAKSIGSDYERHRVLKAALSRRDLTPAVEAGMLDAAVDINSDYELATLLIELNEARHIDDAVRPAFFKAANSLQSDYEHRRVLGAVVSREGMSPAMLLDVLESAKTISSDYELAELLTEVGGAYVLDDALRPAFFAAANTLNSDYEHGRTLLSVVERGDVTRPVALAVLESAKGISSDHELSELLIAVIRRVPMDDTVRAAVQADAETIGSQYDRGRVYEALGRGGRGRGRGRGSN